MKIEVAFRWGWGVGEEATKDLGGTPVISYSFFITLES